MRTFLVILSMLAVSLTGCRRNLQERAVDLSFFVVVAEQIEGGRRIDTPDFPKLGFIRSTPDFAVTRLVSAVTNVMRTTLDAEGTGEREESLLPGITITFLPADAERLADFKRQISRGQSVLLVVGEKPVGAFFMPVPPETRYPGAGQTPFLFLTLRSSGDVQSIVRQLDTPVRHE